MRRTLPISALCALLLLTNACTSESVDTADCPDAPCDQQPSETPPLPQDEVVIALSWEKLTPGDEASDFQGALDLYYCNSEQASFSQAIDENDCIFWNNSPASLQPDGADAVPVTMVNTAGYTDPPNYIVHDALPSGRTHIVAMGHNHTDAIRAHARVYLAGELIWEASQEIGANDIQTPWYAGSIDWHEDLAQVTVSPGIPCADAAEPACHAESEVLYEKYATLSFPQD
ncbi:hypothetical protein EA187_20000 [Lujinxingia sediminis]|uniref:Uncharacterized protein n=1 Tax=Lujinxingia sediminis TaxID=2480984 RepID=A0ABY0CMK8_9DELT|nr:hypothetical protein [Lujinxingia sediminis]RVU40414.1 hypothetical protein EA187_20000 [Lujinxingia sediminis]